MKNQFQFLPLLMAFLLVSITDTTALEANHGLRQSSSISNEVSDSWIDAQRAVCNVPTNLTSLVTGPRTVTVSWDAMSGVYGYELTGGVAGQPGSYISPIVIVGASNNSFNVSNLCINFSYEWTVRTVCDNTIPEKSAYATALVFTTGTCGSVVPATTNISGNSAVLMWTQVSNSIGYRITGQIQGGPTLNIDLTGATNNSLSLSNLMSGNYLWSVKAVCATSTPCSSSPHYGLSSAHAFTITGPPAKYEIATLDQFNSETSNLKLFPNPASDMVNIQLPNVHQQEPFMIELYNLNGQLILSEITFSSGTFVLHTGACKSGIYQLIVRNSSRMSIEKLVIAK